MRQDQLEKARATRWHQDGNALVTLDDAERWLAETPLCLYLPRRVHLPVPAPSFVEAVAGAADATPNAERLAAAGEMLSRLVASGAVVALSLFGAPAGVGGEQPDFLATPEALPFLYALQPDRNPKRAPSTAGTGRVSPLAAEAYKTLERDGAQTAIELRERLGREVTEAAVLRALSELWHTMRAVPVPATAGELDLATGAHWELLVARHRRELSVGSTQSQTTALAMLVSFYLRSAVAATGEDVELFLSPVSSRARIRDVVHGLTATRQLGEFSLHGNAQLYVEGSLPEIVEEEEMLKGEDAGLETNEPSFAESAGISVEAAPASYKRPTTQRSPRPAFGDRARTGFAARGRGTSSSAPSGDRPPRREGGFRKPADGEFRRRSEAGRGADRGPDRPDARSRTDARPRTDRSGSSAPRTDRPRADRPPRTNRLTSSGQPRRPGGGFRSERTPGSRPPFRSGAGGGAARPASRSFVRREDGGAAPRPPAREAGAGAETARSYNKPYEPRKPYAPKKPYGSGAERPGSDRPFKKPFAPRAGGAARPERAAGDRPFKKPYAARGERPSGDRPFKKDYPPRRKDAGDRGSFKKPYAPRTAAAGPEGAGAPRAARPEGERPFKKPYAPRADRPAGDRPFKKSYAPRAGGARSERPSGDRPFKKPFAPRSARPGAAGEGPQRSSYPARPRAVGAAKRPYTPRPAGSASPGGAGGSRSQGAAGRPSFSKAPGRAGGFGKTGGKPGFSKSGLAGKGFGAPRPGGPRGPAAGRPRSAGPARGAGAGRGVGSARPGGFSPPRRKPTAPPSGDEG